MRNNDNDAPGAESLSPPHATASPQGPSSSPEQTPATTESEAPASSWLTGAARHPAASVDSIVAEDDDSSLVERTEKNKANMGKHPSPAIQVQAGPPAPAPTDSPAPAPTGSPAPAPTGPGKDARRVTGRVVGAGVRRELSKETIRGYTAVAAQDNNIYYDEFVRLMDTEPYLPLLRTISKFTTTALREDAPVEEARFSAFMRRCMQMAQQTNRTVAKGDAHRLEFLNSLVAEGVERFITTKLYLQMFNVRAEDKKNGQRLTLRFQQLQQLTAAELDALSEVEAHHLWGQAMVELEVMGHFKSPKEKLSCAVRSARLLDGILKDVLRQRQEKKGQRRGSAGFDAGGIVGADQFLPCFMLLVLRAAPSYFYENIMFLLRFRTLPLCSAEENYCLANLESAAQFWLRCDDTGHIPPEHTPPQSGTTTTTTTTAGAAPPAGRSRSASPTAGHTTSGAGTQRSASPSPAPVGVSSPGVTGVMNSLFGRDRLKPRHTATTHNTVPPGGDATAGLALPSFIATPLARVTGIATAPAADTTAPAAPALLHQRPSPAAHATNGSSLQLAPAEGPPGMAALPKNERSPRRYSDLDVQRWLVEERIPFENLRVDQPSAAPSPPLIPGFGLFLLSLFSSCSTEHRGGGNGMEEEEKETEDLSASAGLHCVLPSPFHFVRSPPPFFFSLSHSSFASFFFYYLSPYLALTWKKYGGQQRHQ
eukprot:gene11005-7648_t